MDAPAGIEDLWPANFGTSSVVPPVVILKQQAAILTQRTRRILQGEVLSEAGEETVYHNFYIKASALDNYRYKLFWVSHNVASLYPVTVSDHEGSYTDEEALRRVLRDIFASEKTIKVVQSLMAQSEADAKGSF